jgi:hypothetical protein
LNSPSQSAGNFTTLRNLTLNSGAGQVAVPPGTYGSFAANSGTSFVFGVAGSTEPAIYNLQNLTLNSSNGLQIIGPVILTLQNSVSVNSSSTVGASTHPEWLTLRLSSGGLTLNSNAQFHGHLIAPSGTVTINGNSTLHGDTVSDRLILNGGLLDDAP